MELTQEIIDNAPEGATHYMTYDNNGNGEYGKIIEGSGLYRDMSEGGFFIFSDNCIAHKLPTKLKSAREKFQHEEINDPWKGQHGGSHYSSLTIQPLQYTLGAMGYEAFKGACHNHIARYTTRKKDNEVEQLKKARHILDLWIHEAEKQENK